MAFFANTTAAAAWQTGEFLAREAARTRRDTCDRDSASSAMAIGGGRFSTSSSSSSDENAARAQRHSLSMSDNTTDGVSGGSRRSGYFNRMNSRSLNEEYSTASTYSDDSACSVDGTKLRNSLPERVASASTDAGTLVRHGTDPHLNDRYYAALLDAGNYVKMGWLTKQGHVWKNWKNRHFVLFFDGTLAYYKSKSKRRMKGCIKLNEGVVSIQHVDIRRSGKPYVFQVEKGYYRMWCCCISQREAELWVNALRGIRDKSPPCFEPLLTVVAEQTGFKGVTDQLNKIFMTDAKIQSMLQAFKSSIVPRSIDVVSQVIVRLEDAILDRYQGYLYTHPDVEPLSGNELIKYLRRHVEDRVFIPTAAFIYTTLDNSRIRAARSRITKNMKLLKTKSQRELGVPDEVAAISAGWAHAQCIVDALDCMSLPSHKIELIISAGNGIVARVADHHGVLAEVADETLAAVFRFLLVNSSLDDVAILHALLKPIYLDHPACQNQWNIVAAFLNAIAWIDAYQVEKDDAAKSATDGTSLASSRVVVSISTADVGILFTTDGNGRGAIVHTVRKLSQAALSEKILPGLSLIAINDEPVILMPFRDICHRLRTAALPKKLTFMPEFFYYQLLSLDSDMYQYLFCMAASRNDKDSVAWLASSQLDVNELCSWEKTRGPQVLGYTPPSSQGSAIHAASFNGHQDMMDYLLRLSASPNLEDWQGRTPLHILSTRTRDMVAIIERLQSAGAKLDATDRDGVTPLMSMARRGSLEGVTTLLALGAQIDAVAWSTGYSSLEYAVADRASDVVELLLSKGADPNRATLDGDTSLHIAAALSSPDMIRLLIHAGGDVNRQNRFGQTPAAVLLAQASHRTSTSSVSRCLSILATAGCEVDRPDVLGRHLLHLAQLSNDDGVCQLMQRLLHSEESNGDLVVDIFGCTARDYRSENPRANELAQIRQRDPRFMWSAALKHTKGGGARQPASVSRSKSFDELMHTLLHDVSVDLADLVAFVMFLESFANLDLVIRHLRECVSNSSQSRNLLRFIVVLVVFKLRHSKEDDASLVEVRALIERHRRRMSFKAMVLLDDYKKMFEHYFALQGSPKSLDQYVSMPITMQQRYGMGSAPTFSTEFPRNISIQVEPCQWAEHCTLLTHTLFSSIPVEDFVSVGSKVQHSRQFLSAKRWFQHLTAYVINAVLVEDNREGRVEVIRFFLSAAECCLVLRNYDTLAAILYALQSTAVQRLRRTLDCLPVDSKKLLNKMQGLSDKGCRDVSKLMHAAENPSMPYIGLYLQGFVGLNELPAIEKGDRVNGGRLRRMGELTVEILHRRSVAYHLSFHDDVEAILHVKFPYPTDDSRYSRSLQLEPREAGAAPLGDRSTYVEADRVDIDSEVRESIGSEGTFGIRQWFRMQKVVHRNRSRSATQLAAYEWV